MSVDDVNPEAGAGAAAAGSSPAQADEPTEPNTPNAVENFDALLDAYEEQASSIEIGQTVLGAVLQINEQSVVIDIGYKTEGVISAEELRGGLTEVKVGDQIQVVIKQLEGPDGYVRLSYAEAVRKKSWEFIEEAANTGQSIKGRVADKVKGGLKVNLGGVEAFLPASQVDIHQVRNLDAWKGKDVDVRIIKVNKKQNNIVVSRRAILEEEQLRRRGEVLAGLEEGFIVEGRVKSLTDYGAFVDIGGVDGLLHITDMSWKRVKHPKDLFKPGDVLQVKVLKLDRESGRINLGYKQLLPDPWDTMQERFPAGTRVKGTIARVANYGAFVELEEGVEGLVHVSEMSWDKRLKHPSKYVKVGQELAVEVLSVDPQSRRLSLSLRQLEPDPWQLFAETHSPGTHVRGRVRGLTDFGAFVEIEKGIEGLVHVSDISRRRVKNPSEVLKKGQEVEAVILNIDLVNRKLSLSMRELEPDPWQQFFDTHRAGDLVNGKIARFASFGAFVDLGGGVEGLCHISELSEERVEKPEDAAKVGQELHFRILKLDPGQKRIGLSARAAKKEEEAPAYIVGEDSGRIASLGDIAGFGVEKAEE